MRHPRTLALLTLLMLAAPVVAAGPTDRLPADTLVYAHWAGRSLTFDGSMFGQMVNDPTNTQLMQYLLDALRTEAKGNDRIALNHGLAMAGIAWQHPVTVALVDVDMKHWGEAKLAVMIDLGKDRDAFNKELEGLLKLMAGGRRPRPTTAPADEQQQTPAEQPEVSLDEALPTRMIGEAEVRNVGPMTLGYLGNMFFVTLGEGVAEFLAQPDAAKALTQSEAFNAAVKQVGGPNGEALQMLLYVDAKSLAARLKQMAGGGTDADSGAPVQRDPADKMLDALGVDGVTTMAGSWRIAEKGMLSTFRINTPQPHEGIASLFDGQPLTDADLATIPTDADFGLLANIEPAKVYEQVRRGVQIMSGEEGMQDFDATIGAFEKTLELSLKDDLLAALGDTWTLSMADSQGGLVTGLLLSVEVRDEQKLKTVLEKVSNVAAGMILAEQMQRRGTEEAIAPPIQSLQVGGATVQYLRMPGEGAQWAFLPAWCVHEKRFYLAGWPQTIASTLTSDAKRLAANAEFKRLRAKLPAEASWITWTNTPQLARKFYPLYVILGTLGTNAAAGEIRTSAVPPLWPAALSEMTKYIWPAASTVSADDGGITVQGYSSGPTLLPGGVAGVTIGAAVALPALNSARHKAKMAVSASNLNSIGKMTAIYSAEYGEKLPASLGDLAEMDNSTRLFVSPLSGRPAPRWNSQAKRLEGQVDYILIDYTALGDMNSLKPDMLLAYERPENYRPGDRVFVLFGDLHVSPVSQAELTSLIEAAKKAGGKLPE